MLYIFLGNILTLSKYHLLLYIFLFLYILYFPINILVRISKLEENFNLRFAKFFLHDIFTQFSVFLPIKL